MIIYCFIISDNPLSVADDVSDTTEPTNLVDTKDIVHNSTMADNSEVNGTSTVEDTSDSKPSFIVCAKKYFNFLISIEHSFKIAIWCRSVRMLIQFKKPGKLLMSFHRICTKVNMAVLVMLPKKGND